ncbi:hypothetical protein IPJ70_02985 [Candidatus Campbellbacteria bacterium]|nr:MAG: hypothetical protein IPJ70_02985 [Candidatus Campbellbacteria bacterium]
MDHRITADDGQGGVTHVIMSRELLSKMVGNAILESVLASMQIEGEEFPPGVHVELQEPVILPEALLNTDKSAPRKR